MDTISINGIEEAKPLVTVMKLCYEQLPFPSKFQLFLAATAQDWPIDVDVAQDALERKLVESVTALGEGKASVRFHNSIANIIAWMNGEKPYYLRA
jgi:hypothetical protein